MLLWEYTGGRSRYLLDKSNKTSKSEHALVIRRCSHPETMRQTHSKWIRGMGTNTNTSLILTGTLCLGPDFHTSWWEVLCHSNLILSSASGSMGQSSLIGIMSRSKMICLILLSRYSGSDKMIIQQERYSRMDRRWLKSTSQNRQWTNL